MESNVGMELAEIRRRLNEQDKQVREQTEALNYIAKSINTMNQVLAEILQELKDQKKVKPAPENM